MRLADRTPAGRGGKRPLTARAVSPLSAPVVRRPVFAPCGARPPACWAAPLAPTPCGVVSSAWSRCRSTLPDRSTASWGSRAPTVLRRAGRCPPPNTGAGAPQNAGAFCIWRLPQPSIRPAGAGAISGAAPRQRLASRLMRCAPPAGATYVPVRWLGHVLACQFQNAWQHHELLRRYVVSKCDRIGDGLGVGRQRISGTSV